MEIIGLFENLTGQRTEDAKERGRKWKPAPIVVDKAAAIRQRVRDIEDDVPAAAVSAAHHYCAIRLPSRECHLHA